MTYSTTLEKVEAVMHDCGTHEIHDVLTDGSVVYVELKVEDEDDPMGDGDVKHGCFPSVVYVAVCDSEEDSENENINTEKTETLRGLIEGLIQTI